MGAGVLETGISLSLGEAASSCSLISPAIYRRFIKPYHQEIVRFFREKKAGLSLHVCGYIDPIMEDLVELGIGALSLDSPSSLRRMVEISQKRIALIGNVATSLFASGTGERLSLRSEIASAWRRPGEPTSYPPGANFPITPPWTAPNSSSRPPRSTGKRKGSWGWGGEFRLTISL